MSENLLIPPAERKPSLCERHPDSRVRAHGTVVPPISPWLLRGFTWYCRRYLQRHFHSLRVDRAGMEPAVAGWPLLVFANHASWWDPLIGLVLKAELFATRRLYCPIDAESLNRYRILGRLGFFGVERDRFTGASRFLRTAEAIMSDQSSLLIATPQGRFVDVRERPVRFEGGLAHLAARLKRAIFLPAAIEYVFWEERLPEILVRFGEPVTISPAAAPEFGAADWNDRLQQKLAATQDELAGRAQNRDPASFRTLLAGDAGQGGIYELWRHCEARARGAKFRKEHGQK